MKGLPQILSILGIAAASAFGLASCGGDEVTCGTGTHLDGEMCVPDSTTTCGTGTTLMGDECVPDGSVICEQGTRFDMATGQCVVDPSACAEGTVLVGGECVPEDDTLTADLEEAAEPNDTMGAGDFNVPALNADVTLHGCISPRAGARDEDIWIMTATGPTLLEITADGVGGLAAGFIVQDNGIPSLPNYFRAGLNLTGDTSHRQVFLPAAGDYLLVMDDSRAILVDEVAGGPETCYYTTVKTVAMPAATAVTTPTTTGEDVGNVRVLTYTAATEGELLRASLTTTSASLSPGFVVMRNNLPTGVGAPITNTTTGAVQPPTSYQGLANAEVVTIVIDHQYNFSPNPTPYTLTPATVATTALPTAGGMATLSGRRAGADGTADPSKMNFLYFDVPANGALMQWNLISSVAVDLVVVRRDIGLFSSSGFTFAAQGVANAFGGTGTAAINPAFSRFLTAGRYYLAVQNPAAAASVGETITITSTLAPITPAPLTYGTAVTAQALPASFASFHTIDLTSPTWVEFAATGTNWGTNINVNLYDLAGEGFVGSAGYPAAIVTSKPANGSDPAGRIMIGDTRDFLVRVSPSTVPGANPTYDLNIRTRPHIALGAITPGTPITHTADAIAAGSDAAGAQNVTRYLVTGSSFARVALTATPAAAQASNINIRWRNADESVNGPAVDAGGDGAAETINASFPAFPGSWAAFTVGSSDTEASTIDINTTSLDPRYSAASGVLAFTDACTGTGGGPVTFTTAPFPGDEAQTALLNLPNGWSFPFFGVTQTQFYINANGFLGFGTPPSCTGGGTFCSFTNASALNANDTNGWVAAFWDDMVNVQACRKDDGAANTVTIQWTGVSAAGNVQAQAVLHMNGAIDVIYGPAHTATGALATVGIEAVAGNEAYQSVFNTAGVLPNTSRTYTPAP